MPLRFKLLSLSIFALLFGSLLVYTSHHEPRTEMMKATQASNPVRAVIITTTTVPITTTIPPTNTTTRHLIKTIQQPPEQTAPSPPAQPSGEIEQMIYSVFGSEGANAVRVARCESNLNPDASSGQYRGLFQLGNYHRHRAERLGYTWDDMYSAMPNILTAYDLWKEQNWQPWSCHP